MTEWVLLLLFANGAVTSISGLPSETACQRLAIDAKVAVRHMARENEDRGFVFACLPVHEEDT